MSAPRNLPEMTPFDLLGELPTGTTVLEASAGTGKTYTIAALVARYVAEGVATLDEMPVITFSRMASQELRERVRSRLVAAERALSEPAGIPAGEEFLELLCGVGASELHERRRRIAEALADFDGATIATTHQFCQLVLRSLGVAGDSDAATTLVETSTSSSSRWSTTSTCVSTAAPPSRRPSTAPSRLLRETHDLSTYRRRGGRRRCHCLRRMASREVGKRRSGNRNLYSGGCGV
jgi:hypothetical protein